MGIVEGLAVFSGVSFVAYGLSCLQSSAMALEFERFGLTKFRVLTGVLEVCGGVGLLVGLRSALLLWMAATGLTMLMALGVGVRVRLRDSVWQTLPALALFIVNGYVAVSAWQLLRA
jgi:hypothetical protein